MSGGSENNEKRSVLAAVARPATTTRGSFSSHRYDIQIMLLKRLSAALALYLAAD